MHVPASDSARVRGAPQGTGPRLVARLAAPAGADAGRPSMTIAQRTSCCATSSAMTRAMDNLNAFVLHERGEHPFKDLVTAFRASDAAQTAAKGAGA